MQSVVLYTYNWQPQLPVDTVLSQSGSLDCPDYDHTPAVLIGIMRARLVLSALDLLPPLILSIAMVMGYNEKYSVWQYNVTVLFYRMIWLFYGCPFYVLCWNGCRMKWFRGLQSDQALKKRAQKWWQGFSLFKAGTKEPFNVQKYIRQLTWKTNHPW